METLRRRSELQPQEARFCRGRFCGLRPWGVWLAVILALSPLARAYAQVDPPAGEPAKSPQPYIFWAYGLACLLLFLFGLWTVAQSRRNAERIARLRERLDAAVGPDSAVR